MSKANCGGPDGGSDINKSHKLEGDEPLQDLAGPSGEDLDVAEEQAKDFCGPSVEIVSIEEFSDIILGFKESTRDLIDFLNVPKHGSMLEDLGDKLIEFPSGVFLQITSFIGEGDQALVLEAKRFRKDGREDSVAVKLFIPFECLSSDLQEDGSVRHEAKPEWVQRELSAFRKLSEWSDSSEEQLTRYFPDFYEEVCFAIPGEDQFVQIVVMEKIEQAQILGDRFEDFSQQVKLTKGQGLSGVDVEHVFRCLSRHIDVLEAYLDHGVVYVDTNPGNLMLQRDNLDEDYYIPRAVDLAGAQLFNPKDMVKRKEAAQDICKSIGFFMRDYSCDLMADWMKKRPLEVDLLDGTLKAAEDDLITLGELKSVFEFLERNAGKEQAVLDYFYELYEAGKIAE